MRETGFIAPFTFVGLKNYAGIFTERRYWAALEHGLIYAFATVSLQLVIGNRTGPHDAHLAFQDVKKLRQLV